MGDPNIWISGYLGEKSNVGTHAEVTFTWCGCHEMTWEVLSIARNRSNSLLSLKPICCGKNSAG